MVSAIAQTDERPRADGSGATLVICNHGGDTYQGEFPNGQKHGSGVYTFADGTKVEGTRILKIISNQGNVKTISRIHLK